MATKLIPFRTVWYTVPANHVLEVLNVILDRKIRYKITNISTDNNSLKMYISVNLAKAYQRDAIPVIEKMLEIEKTTKI